MGYYELMHYGVKGMKWGVRKYQNSDGSLTPEGQKRYAKSIQRAARDSSSAGRDRLRKAIYDDIATNYGNHMKDHIANIAAKKKAWLKIDSPENDYWDSGAARKDSAAAHKQTIDYFKKNNPAYLAEIRQKAGGDDAKLDMFHDFRKVYEGYEDTAWQRGEKQFYKDRGINPKAKDRAYDEYIKACRSASETILGRYGNTPIPKEHSYDRGDLNELITDMLISMANEK